MESCSGSIDFTIPSNQDGTFASANICVAKSRTADGTNKDNLVFSNATSILEFSQTAASTDVLRVAVTAANAIAGKLTATFGDDNKAIISTSGLTRKIIWTTAPSTAQDKYYIAIAPVTTGTVNFVYNKILDEASVNKRSNTLVRNKIYELTIPTEGYVNSYVFIGDKKWAKYNLGATAVATSREICYGDLYMWRATELAYESLSGNVFTFKSSTPASYSNTTWDSAKGFVWENCNYTDGVFDSSSRKNVFTKYTTDNAYARSGQKDGLDVLEDIDDVVKQKIDHGWRMPTKDDFWALAKACKPDYSSGDITPAIADNAEGVSARERGIYYCSNYSAGDGIVGLLFCDGLNNKLFFPAVGYGYKNDLLCPNSNGNYWSSTLSSSADYAYFLTFARNDVNPQFGFGERRQGYSVRPVLD